MNFDEALAIWQSQDDTSQFEINRERLIIELQREDDRMMGQLKAERLTTYAISFAMLCGIALISFLMVFDDDPRSPWDFVAAGVAGVATISWGCIAFFSKTRLRKEAGSPAHTFREEVERNLAIVKFKLSNYGSTQAAILQSTPFVVGLTLVFLLVVRLNNQPLGISQLRPLIVTIFVMFLITLSAARSARKGLESTKQKLEELSRQLVSSGDESI